MALKFGGRGEGGKAVVHLLEEEGEEGVAAGVELVGHSPTHFKHELPHPLTQLWLLPQAADDHLDQRILVSNLGGREGKMEGEEGGEEGSIPM